MVCSEPARVPTMRTILIASLLLTLAACGDDDKSCTYLNDNTTGVKWVGDCPEIADAGADVAAAGAAGTGGAVVDPGGEPAVALMGRHYG